MKWYGDQHLAVGHHWHPKKWAQGNGGSQKKLVTAHRGMTCHAGVAQHKGRGHTRTDDQTETVEKSDQGQCCKRNL
jgi:hypothetical protein